MSEHIETQMINVCNVIYAKQILNVTKILVEQVFSVNWERKSKYKPPKTPLKSYRLKSIFFFFFCRYATSFVLERTTGNTFESFYDAGRRGRSGENCRQIYLECNEV